MGVIERDTRSLDCSSYRVQSLGFGVKRQLRRRDRFEGWTNKLERHVKWSRNCAYVVFMGIVV